MAIDVIDFEDLPEDEATDNEKMVNITVKVSEDIREMFARISKRERRNMSVLGAMVLEQYIVDYTEKYKKEKTGDKKA